MFQSDIEVLIQFIRITIDQVRCHYIYKYKNALPKETRNWHQIVASNELYSWILKLSPKLSIKILALLTDDKVTHIDNEFYTIFPSKMENFSLTQFYQEQEEWLCTQFIT